VIEEGYRFNVPLYLFPTQAEPVSQSYFQVSNPASSWTRSRKPKIRMILWCASTNRAAPFSHTYKYGFVDRISKRIANCCVLWQYAKK
jgi:hypothetical protein